MYAARLGIVRMNGDRLTICHRVQFAQRTVIQLAVQTMRRMSRKYLQLFRKLGLNPQQTAVLAGDNEQQQRLEQALMTPDTDEYYNAAAL